MNRLRRALADPRLGPWLRRGSLCALAVLACYQLDWTFLRFLTSEAILRISAALGFPVARVSADTLQVGGLQLRFVIACTFADVYCGALPLLWNSRRSYLHNLLEFAVFGAALFFFNLLRLEGGLVGYMKGVPWELAHGVEGGVAYFLVWLWIEHRRSWALPTRLRPTASPRRVLAS
jgi:hypothetical protein